MRKAACCMLLVGAWTSSLAGVTIHIDARDRRGPLKPVWAYFGYDEPNYTYMTHGRKLLSELAALSPVPVYVRAHNLLTTGDGTPALKWGSTNAYTEHASGRPVHDWTIIDRIFDTYVERGMKPLVEIGFMPEALSVKPQPYTHSFPQGRITAGWAYPPKDYKKWADLIYQWVNHSIQRYGKPEVESWYWEVWNEPNILYWQGTPEEYYKLYDYAADAVRRALPSAKVGGPHSTGPGSPQAAEFLRNFLEHCLRGVNHATGRAGSPLDFIGFHAKGRPNVVEGRVRMGIAKHLTDIARGFEIIASYPELHGRPVILGETDPEGCAACSARVNPQNAYRNGALYAVYSAAVLARTYDLAERHGINLAGAVTWAFEFEGQPYFDGFRTLATNGINKPVLNFFRMMGLMGSERLGVKNSGAASLKAMIESGVQGEPDIGAMASGRERAIAALVWNYHDDDIEGPAAPVEVMVTDLPDDLNRVLLRHYRIDEETSNSYTVWKRMGSPQNFSPAQYSHLEAAGQLQLLTSPEWKKVDAGSARIEFALPRQAVSLVELTW